MKNPCPENSCTFLLLFILPFSAFSQRTLNGRVVDQQGKPVFAANIYLKNNIARGTASDMEGLFSLPIMEKEYADSLVISIVGYVKKIIPLVNVNWEAANVYQLSEDVSSLGEVTIVSKASLAEEFSTKKLDRISIYMSPVSSADPLKAITLLPASTNTSETANPELRGSSGDYSRVVLNGVPIYKPARNGQLNGTGNFSILNTELIDFQNVYAGNPPLNFGNSIAGLVEIGTRTELEEKQTKVAASPGNIGLLYAAPFRKKTTFLQTFGNFQFSEAYLLLNRKGVPFIKNFKNHDMGINFHYAVTEHLTANTFSYFIEEGYLAESTLYNYLGDMNFKNRRYFNVLNLRYKKKKTIFSFNNGVNLSAAGYSLGNIRNTTRETQSYNTIEMKCFPFSGISFQTGLTHEYFNDRFSNTLPVNYFAVFPDDRSFSFEHRKENHSTEAYGYGRYTSEKIIIGIGVRKNILLNDQPNYTSWQGSLRYSFFNKNSLLLSGGKYNGYTTPNYFVQSFNPLSASQYTIEYNYKSDNTSISAAAYKKKETALQYYRELGTATSTTQDIKGIELSAEQRIKHFLLFSSYTWLDTKFSKGDGWYRNSNDMNYLVKLAVSYNNIKLFNCAVSCIIRPGHFFTPVTGAKETQSVSGFEPLFGTYNSQQLGGYTTLDITINKLVTWKSKMLIPFFSLTNSMNSSNHSAPLYSRDYKTITDYWYYQKRLVYFGVQLSL